ncbi:MAG: hypothetical protein IJ221_03965 [Oscillibacter sp.]|nr:hypothetical protein [Oscillibacter sp.]
MNGIPNEERQRLGALLDTAPQTEVMGMIPQFSRAEIYNIAAAPAAVPAELGISVFNMERGVHLAELGDFLETCPGMQPFDVILANELDDGCVRSGGKDTARELARRLGLNYVFGLEFIELVNGADPKGFHGNAIFSRFPIKRAQIVRLPEQYNWYFDRQRRIGGRLAILAELDVGGRPLGVGTIHLENRTHGPGRQAQLETVLRAAEEMFPHMPVALGGDLNTNTFDGRDTDAIGEIAADPALQRRCLEDVAAWEGCLPAATAMGYTLEPQKPILTRRKPLPGGGHLDLRLDWLLLRGLTASSSRTISTAREDCGFAKPGSALASFQGAELSDHNAIWASCRLDG